MKSEPLFGKEKSKRQIVPEGTKIHLPNSNLKIASCELYYFKEKDIKSAVEWLKDYFSDTIHIDWNGREINNVIDKAFQDVMKK